jgi:hypothetical protein
MKISRSTVHGNFCWAQNSTAQLPFLQCGKGQCNELGWEKFLLVKISAYSGIAPCGHPWKADIYDNADCSYPKLIFITHVWGVRYMYIVVLCVSVRVCLLPCYQLRTSFVSLKCSALRFLMAVELYSLCGFSWKRFLQEFRWHLLVTTTFFAP